MSIGAADAGMDDDDDDDDAGDRVVLACKAAMESLEKAWEIDVQG